MTEDNVNMDTATPSDEVTNAPLGSADTTINHEVDTGPILLKILEDLAGDEDSKGEAKSLLKWIDDSEWPKQDLQMRDSHGRTLLHVAAADGLSEAARKLVDIKALLDAQDEDGETPLCAACCNGHKDIVELLLGAGADTTIAKERQRTPLYVAANLGFESIVQLLCKNPGKDLDIQETWLEWTPLHTAAYDGKKTIVRYLKDAGARLDLQDEDGWTPIMTAVVKEGEDVLKILLEGLEDGDKSLEIEDSEGRTPLLRAAQECFWEGARLLVMAGAKCDKSKSTDTDSTSVVTPRQDSALHLAVSANQLEMVRLLLDKGANINALNDQGQHSCHLASSKGSEGILKLLLDTMDSKGLNARNDDGMTPLHLACNADEYDDDEPNGDEQETLDVTANGQTEANASMSKPGQHNEVVRLLLQRHADTTAVTNDNKTALELAFYSNHHSVLKTILQYLPGNSEEFSHALLRAASDREGHRIVKSLFKSQLQQLGTSLPVESESWTAIEWAAYIANPDALLFLIASSPQNEDTKIAIKKANDLVLSEDQLAKPVTKPGDRKRGEAGETKKSDNRKKPNKSADKVNLIQDYLDDPLIGLICSDEQEYSTPSFEGQPSSILDEYTVSIVQFHKQVGRFGKIKRSRTVKKAIYTEGPKKIMDDVGSMLERLAKVEVEQGSSTTNFMGTKSQFTWIHLPATNMTWMNDLLQRIMYDQKKSASKFNQAKSFFKDSWIQIPDSISPSRIMRPRFAWCDTNGHDGQSEESKEKNASGHISIENKNKEGTMGNTVAEPTMVEPPVAVTPLAARLATAIYMPYFSYSFQCCEANRNEKHSEKLIKSQDQFGSTSTMAKEPTSPQGPATASPEAGKLEQDRQNEYADTLSEKWKQYQTLLKEYKEKVIHGSSTLDESYYHFADDDEDSQKDKERRNKTQVVTGSWLKTPKLGPYWPLIRVNQLWIWTIDDKWLISATSHPIDDSENELLNGILDLLEKQGEAGGSDLQPSTASEMSELIVDYCVESYERKPRNTQEERPADCKLDDLSIRQAFSKSINSIARGETNLFEQFGEMKKKLSSFKNQSENVQGSWLDKQLTDATIEAENLSGKVKDILDELNILESTVQYQQIVQRSMKALKMVKKQELQRAISVMKKDDVLETDLTATYVINDIKRLDSVAKRVHDAVNTTLSLQQSEVANLQAKLSLQQANDSARQGRVLMIFTVVTILFLPLSFLTSLFALDVSSFLVPAWVIGIIFSVSIAFFIPTATLAFIPPRSIMRFIVNLPGSVATDSVRIVHYIKKLVTTAKEMRNGNGTSSPDPEKGLE